MLDPVGKVNQQTFLISLHYYSIYKVIQPMLPISVLNLV